MDWDHAMEWMVDLYFEMKLYNEMEGFFDLEVERNLC